MCMCAYIHGPLISLSVMYIKLVLKSNIKPIKPNDFIAPLALKLQIIKNNFFFKNPKFKSPEKLEKIKK